MAGITFLNLLYPQEQTFGQGQVQAPGVPQLRWLRRRDQGQRTAPVASVALHALWLVKIPYTGESLAIRASAG